MNPLQWRTSLQNKIIRNRLKNTLVQISAYLIEEVHSLMEKERLFSKRTWVRKWIARRPSRGASALLLKELSVEDPEEYRLCLRLAPDKFEKLLNVISPIIQKSDTLLRNAITARIKLEVTLNFLATGNSYRTLQYLFRVPKSTISKFIPEVCDAIFDSLKKYIQVPETPQDRKEISVGFESRWNFPRCCGAIDGKHILIQAPPNCGTEFFNYKGTNSVVLMAVVDYNYCFTYIDAGCNGIVSDGGVFQNCSLFTPLEKGMLPEGYCLVGDDAFPLKTYLTKPYNAASLTKEEKIFTYRLSRARRIVENAFGILVSRCRIFEKRIACKLSTVDKIVKACCALHNWLRITDAKNYFVLGAIDEEIIATGEIIPGRWRSDVIEMRTITKPVSGYRSSRLAREFRDHIKSYVNNEGIVPWQEAKIY